MSSKIPITIIIADYASQTSITDCLKNISSWSPRKIIVSNNPKLKEQFPELTTSELIFFDSKSSYQLWKKGINESKTQWNLLITSDEIVTGQLKNSIENQVKNSPDTEELFNIRKKVIFFKKVLKYPLLWSDEFPSSLIFIPDLKNFTLKLGVYKTNSYLGGEIARFGKCSLSESVSEVLRLADIQAEKLFQSPENKNLVVLIFKSFFKAGLELFVNLVWKKGFHEGYEGIVFSLLGSTIPLFTLLRYYEKYFREGKIIANNLDKIKNILIIKLGGTGDVILATPVIRNFKKIIPQANIHVLVLNGAESLLNNNPYIDSTTTINFDAKTQEIKEISNMLKSRKIDLAINLQSTNFSGKVLGRVSSRWKINRSYFFRDKNTDVLVGFTNTYRSVIERDLDVLRSIGLNPVDKNTEVFLGQNEIEWAKEFFSLNGLSSKNKIVTIHPCSSLEIRSWGIDNFAFLCKKIISEINCQIIINCSSKELETVQPIKRLVPEVCLFSGSLRELLSIVNESDLFIGNDSGPSHLSVALDVPTITLNGPSTSSFFRDPDLFRGKHYTFNKEVHCRDLFHTQCMSKIDPTTNHPICDSMICLDFSVDEVAAKALEFLR
jgi:ADP-heptose:LPS heptosyltransferase